MPNKKGTRTLRGEGSIRLRPDGLYECRVSLGYRDGKRITKSIYAKTEAEIVKRKALLLAQYGLGALPQPEKLTVEELLLRWLEIKEREVKATTYDSYRNAVHKHILPRLGRIQVQKLELYHLEDFYRTLARAGLKRGTIRQAHVALSNALSLARRWKVIPFNPADGAVLPQDKERFEPKTWTAEEARKFLEAARGDRLYALYWLALTGSFRRGELLGLKWDAISLEQHSVYGPYVAIRVVNNRTYAGSKVVEHSPKTHRSKRPVILPYEAWEVLQAHRRRMETERAELIRQGYTPDDQGYVFLSPLHEPWHPSNFYNRAWLPLLKRAGVTEIRFHDLRHSSLTLDLASGGDLKTASQRAGHSSVTITAGVYQHPDLAQHLEATSRIAQLLNVKKPVTDTRLN